MDWSLGQDGSVNFEEVLQGVFSGKVEGTPVDSPLEVFVFHQRFANLADTDMRTFHPPDLTALERLDRDALFLGQVFHGCQLNTVEIQKRGKSLSKRTNVSTEAREGNEGMQLVKVWMRSRFIAWLKLE